MSFPETIPSKSAQWATMCRDRSPEFKVHSAKGLAHSAIANKKPYAEIALYENINGVWTKVWEYVYPEICRCGNLFHGGPYRISPTHEGGVRDADVICIDCYSKESQIKREAQEFERNRRELARLQAKQAELQPRVYGHINLGDLTAKD